MLLPNEFPFIAVTDPKIEYCNATISFIVGTHVKDMNMEAIDHRVLGYILSYFEPMIGRVSLDFDVEDFRGLFMNFLGDYFRDLYRSRSVTEFEIESSIIHKNLDLIAPGFKGLDIRKLEPSYIVKKLLQSLVLEHLLEALGNGYKVTQMGIKYCSQINHPIME